MKYTRRYLQFNNLVFDGADIIRDADASVSFKHASQAYSYGHGSYLPLKAESMFLEEQQISMTVVFLIDRLPCEYRPYYRQFILEELSKPGKLWAIQNNELVWADAVLTGYAESNVARAGTIEVDLDFLVYSGVWHKADKLKTFLVPFDICIFMECKGYRTLHPCDSSDNCCQSCQDRHLEEELADECCCCCDELTKDMALCYHLDELQGFYAGCDSPYQIVYDCGKGERLFADKFLGQKICANDSCSHQIVGIVYSETDIPTNGVTVIIDETMHNPAIDINGNKNILNGDYDGVVKIYPNGDAYFQDAACCESLIDPANWVVPEGNDYGWTIHPRNNRISINLNECCGLSCAYIQVDGLTY